MLLFLILLLAPAPELLLERLVLFIEVDVLLRWNAKAEFRYAAVIRDGEVTLVHDIHAN